jgi:putative membrane protein
MTDEKPKPSGLGVTTRLSVARTTMAANRTLMAWLRTALSMISFGFTLYKVIQGFQSGGMEVPIDLHPKRAGLVLIGLGILSIVVGMLEYYLIMREVRKIMPIPYWQHTLWIAVLGLCIAVAIFINILLGTM